jgi:hypothetical protein
MARSQPFATAPIYRTRLHVPDRHRRQVDLNARDGDFSDANSAHCLQLKQADFGVCVKGVSGPRYHCFSKAGGK